MLGGHGTDMVAASRATRAATYCGGMDFGVGYFPTHDGIGPGPLARMLEERGQESLFFAEHTHIPASRVSPWGDGSAELPPKYWHCYDLFVALTAAAAATSRLRIGSGICLVTERDPIITAKEVASVDHISGGRMEFGIGAGWNREEMANHGTDPRTRMALMRERVEAMKAIWTQEEASYDGRFVSFDRIWSHPKPLQRPHPPILVGGDGPTVLDRVLAFGDGWFPHFSPGTLERAAELRARADRPIELHIIGMPADPKAIEQAREAGARRALLWLPTGPAGAVERALEEWETAIADYIGG
jgi:probable F420-dependent oxidoreductase